MNAQVSRQDAILEGQMKEFVSAVQSVYGGLYGKTATASGPSERVNALHVQGDFTVSILFVGTIFGEFIVSMPRTSAVFLAQESLGGESPSDEDLRDSLCEALNMVAGGRLKSLAQDFPKLTITAPKVTAGSVRYPSVKAMQASLDFSGHPVTLSFYLDEMRLDLAESYRESVAQLQTANQELLFANERLKLQQMQLVHSEKMASLGMMAAGVAHEINNPLSFVVSNSEVLASYLSAFQELFGAYQRLLACIADRKPRQAKEELSRVKSIQEEKDIPYILQDTMNLLTESRSGLDRIRGIVNGLKLFSRVDDEGVRKVQINDELKNTLQLIANELKYHCSVDFRPGELPEIECVPGELGQVFVNLLVNASQAMPAEGGVLKIHTSLEGESIAIVVADNGCGIPPENVSKIFDPFFTTKPVGQGTGLGLAITHSIVSKHGGTIEVASELGKGTVFTVRLPLRREKGEEEAA